MSFKEMPDMTSEIEKSEIVAYYASAQVLDDFGKSLKALIDALLFSKNTMIHSVGYRVKGHVSAFEKILGKPEKYSGFESLTDLLGVRVTTYFSDDVDIVGRLLREEFTVDEENSVDKRSELRIDQFGYMSLHLILELNETRSQLPEYVRYKGVKFEVQIRTLLQHAWAEIEHDLGYKAEIGLPVDLRRQFARISAALEGVDKDFEHIRVSIQKYRDSTDRNIEESYVNLEINRITLESYIRKSPLVHELDGVITDFFGAIKSDNINQKVVKLSVVLKELNITNIEILNTHLSTERENLLKFVESFYSQSFPLIKFARFEILQKGTSIAFLVYLLIGRIPDRDQAVKIVELASETPALLNGYILRVLRRAVRSISS